MTNDGIPNDELGSSRDQLRWLLLMQLAERMSCGGLNPEPLEFRHSTFCIRHSRRAGFAGAREVAEEGEEAALVGVGEGFEVVEDEEGAGAGEGVEHLG